MKKHKDIKLKDLGMSPERMKKFAAGARFAFPGPFDDEPPKKHITRGTKAKILSGDAGPFKAPEGPPSDELFRRY